MPTKHISSSPKFRVFSQPARRGGYLVGKEVLHRFDVLELRLDYTLESAVFAMEMQPVLPNQ